MVRSLLILLLLLMLCSFAVAADKPLPRSAGQAGNWPTTIVLIPGDSTWPTSNRGSFAYALPRALRNHLDHYFADRSLDLSISLAERPMAAPEVLSYFVNDMVRHTVLLYYTASIEAETFVARDAHRRRYVAQSDGCLHLKIAYQVYSRAGSEAQLEASGTIESSGQPRPDAVRSRSGAVYCDPHEMVIQRAINELSSYIPAPLRPELSQPANIPVKVYLAPSLARDPRWAAWGAARVVAFASQSLLRQFGHKLTLSSIDTLPEAFAEERALRENAPAFREAIWARGDTLLVVFNRMLGNDEVSAGASHDELGITRLGHRRIYMDLVPSFSPDDTVWLGITNGLTLLHELGHALGAIHVSDAHSIMNHRANWVNAADFDLVNSAIIRAALEGDLHFKDPDEYIRHVSRILAFVPYQLADYPAFFYQYLTWGGNRRINDRLRSAIGRPSYLLAADAYGLLENGQMAGAARLFRQALSHDPDQGALYYYLSLALSAPRADAYRKTAARMGYAMASDSRRQQFPDAKVDIAPRQR